MENDVRTGSADRYDLMLYLYGVPVFLAGLLSLRCFLRSRLVGGAFFLFCAVALGFLVDSFAQGKRGRPGFVVFARFAFSFSVLIVPSIILVFLGVFHPAWIAAGTVFLLAGHVFLSRAGAMLEDRVAVLSIICLSQLVVTPLFLLLYFTGAAVSVFFIWLFPVYCVLVSAGLGVITTFIPVRLLAPFLAVLSMVALLTGLLSEFVF